MVLDREDGAVGLRVETEETMEVKTEEQHQKVTTLVLIVENYGTAIINLTVLPKMLSAIYVGG